MKKRVPRKRCLAAPGLRHLARRIRRKNGEITSDVFWGLRKRHDFSNKKCAER